MNNIELIKKAAEESVNYINEHIQACNISNRKKDNKFFAPLVYLCQKKCDAILGNVEISLLERLLQCADVIEQYQAGNCMQQAFLAFKQLITKFIQLELSNNQSCIPMSIMTTSNHSFLIINNNIVCDPFFKFVGDLKDYKYSGKRREEYFGIRSDWTCFDGIIYDENSIHFADRFLKNTVSCDDSTKMSRAGTH
ncbi:hypothetical protein EP47_04655 [Legionella norrlandica]|uniref:Uncharacterized protein n=1 Tax=Legionella norrlandica TaxID=1498499 RepID=A0A0A2SPM7_9GAMM|nr:hypothetical protein [Legionella norrlandica]KGP63085.1 hypothetical protein EP47_04655 [Legionella norrlandica]